MTVRVAYSSLNYKDGLAVTGRGRVVRRFPMVCGVDLAGEVESSADSSWSVGDQVICTGWGLGDEHWGGYSGAGACAAGLAGTYSHGSRCQVVHVAGHGRAHCDVGPDAP